MKYFFFSDVHIMDGTFKDDFSQKFEDDQRFIDKMDMVKSKVDAMVGVGDIWDLWGSSLRAIKNAHFIVWQWLTENCTLLAGNHDYDTFGNLKMSVITNSGLRVFVSHGFQNNPYMTKGYTRAAIAVVGKLEKWFPNIDNPERWPRIYKLLPAKYRKLYEKKFHEVKGIEKDVEDYVKSFAGKYDIVICGHSHVQGDKVFFKGSEKEIRMLNCGHCTNGTFQGILFDTELDKWELV